MIYKNNLLYFNDNLFLPDPYDYVKAYLEEKLKNVQKLNSYKKLYISDSENEDISILKFFKIQDTVTDESVKLFLNTLSEFINNEFKVREGMFPKPICYFLYDFIDLVSNNLDQNYINLKYGKKYKWKTEQKYNVDYFIKHLGLDSYFKEKIKHLEFEYNLKSAIYNIVLIIFFFSIYYVIEEYHNFFAFLIAIIITVLGYIFATRFNPNER